MILLKHVYVKVINSNIYLFLSFYLVYIARNNLNCCSSIILNTKL